MNNEIKINKANKSITFINNGIAFSQFGIADEILDLITNLQQDTEMYAQLKDEYEEEIKDLQQENEELKKKLDRRYYKNEYERIKQENERLKEEQEYNNYCDKQLRKKISNLEYKITTLENYKSRCEKASEELKSWQLDCNYSKENEIYQYIINILQNGSDSQ